MIRKKWVCMFYIVLGVILALANTYLFLDRRQVWDAVMFVVGIGWIWLGVSNLRRLQNTGPIG